MSWRLCRVDVYISNLYRNLFPKKGISTGCVDKMRFPSMNMHLTPLTHENGARLRRGNGKSDGCRRNI